MRRTALRLWLTALLLSAAASGRASIVTFETQPTYEMTGTGAIMPGVAKATFDDSGLAGSVNLTLDLTDWVGGAGADTAYVAEWYFMSDVPVGSLTFDLNPGGVNSPSVVGNIVDRSGANFGGLGDTFFDWSIDFPPPSGQFEDKFTAGEVVTIAITGAGITAETFAAKETFLGSVGAGVRARSTYTTGSSDSGWFVVPEPSTGLILAGLGLCFGGLASWRQRGKET